MKTIYDFKKGDEVVRVIPAKPYHTGISDRSFLGVKLIFIGIANGISYFKRTDEYSLKLFGDELLELPIDIWDEGWNFFVDPKSLLIQDVEYINDDILDNLIKKAVKDEDYELAAKLNYKKSNAKKK